MPGNRIDHVGIALNSDHFVKLERLPSPSGLRALRVTLAVEDGDALVDLLLEDIAPDGAGRFAAAPETK